MSFYLLSLLAGVIKAVMVVFNGSLSTRVGQGMALVIIHIAALLFLSAAFLIKKERPNLKMLPLWMYTGGLIGIFTTIFNNAAFGSISVSAIMALSLLGESISGLLADHYGLIGLPVRRFRIKKLWGGLMTMIGIAWMLNEFRMIPVVISFLSGVTLLFSRLVNSRLSRETGEKTSAWCSYLAGLLGALLLLLFTKNSMSWSAALTGPPHIYLGGALGAVILLLSNHIVGRISSFSMGLAIFVGKVFASLLLDILLMRTFPASTAVGGLFVLGGLVINLLQDKASGAKKKPGVAQSSSVT